MLLGSTRFGFGGFSMVVIFGNSEIGKRILRFVNGSFLFSFRSIYFGNCLAI